MVGWHHWLIVHEFEQTLGDRAGQESLACCSPWGCKESDMTKWLNYNNNNRKIISTETETMIKKLQTNKSTGPDGFTNENYQTIREELTPILLKDFSKNCRGRNIPKLILQGDHHRDRKTRQRYHKKRKLQSASLMNTEANSSKPNATVH